MNHFVLLCFLSPLEVVQMRLKIYSGVISWVRILLYIGWVVKGKFMINSIANRKFYTSPTFFIIIFTLLFFVWSAQNGWSQTAPAPITFHHVHLNSLDPSAAINFYTKTFEVTKKTSLAGWDAVKSENMYLLFNKVSKAPEAALESPIWHFGWGSTNMETDYQKHLDNGIAFAT